MFDWSFFLALLAALADWYAVFRHLARWRYLTKPLVIALLLLWFTRSGGWEGSGIFFGIALVFSLLGDFFLLKELLRIQPNFFQWGLAAFLVAQVAYLLGFNQPRPLLSLPTLGILVVVGLAGYFNGKRLLTSLRAHPSGRKLTVPVVIYMIAISLMLASALNTLLRSDWLAPAALLASLGAALFYLSDSILAHDKFGQPIRGSEILVMVTYHLAQIAIIASYLTHQVPLWIPY